jgi:DNA uptake protein ComE-like DNA-binding protein
VPNQSVIGARGPRDRSGRCSAAGRIVAHRDEFGRFASVADLSRVEGFDPERVATVAPHLKV